MASTPPTPPLEPLGLDEVKANLRVDDDDSDDLIAALITSARMHVENVTGLVILPQTVTETVPRLGLSIELASWPVTAVTAVRYPLMGVLTELEESGWAVSYRARPVRLLPATPWWGLGSPVPAGPALPVEIDVEAGYASPDDVPRPVKQAIQLLVSHWYANRSAAEVGARAAGVEIPFSVTELLRPYRLARI